MSEMESAFELLAEDSSGRGLGRIREELLSMRTTIRRAMDAGMTAEEMARARNVMEAVDAGERVAERAAALFSN